MKTLLIAALPLIPFCAPAQDLFLGKSKDNVCNFYMMSATVNKRTHTVEVFDRVKPVDGQLPMFRKQVIATREKQNLSTKGFDKLGYYRRKIEYSCKDHTFRLKEATYYDLYGTELNSLEPDDVTPWAPIPPATLRDVEFQKVCK